MKRNAPTAAKPIGFKPRTPAHDREIRRRAALAHLSVTEWIHRKVFTAQEDADLEKAAFRDLARKAQPSNKSV